MESERSPATGLIPVAGTRVDADKTKTTKTMKSYIKTAAAALGLLALGLMVTSCADMQSSGSHEMGPRGKSRTMSDESMPSRAN